MIGAVLLSPFAVLAIDWALWSRIDGMLSCAWHAGSPWRLKRRRWLPLAAIWGWCALVAYRNSLPSGAAEDGVGHGLLIAGIAILIWWIVAILRDVRDQA